jgi:S1-C subfamily serine protease
VIQDGVSARVKLSNGDTYDDVAIAETDRRKDIAILKIRAIHVSWLGFADSGALQVGATVYALGAPKGLDGTLSQGLISGLREGEEVGMDFVGMRVIQFTAPISPGSSGGPVLDETGRVIGLVCGYKRGGQNLNLAIPSQYVAGMVKSWRGQTRRLRTMNDTERTAASRSAAEILSKAKTLCISVPTGGPVLRAEIMSRFLKWGKLTLVSSPDYADLVLDVVQTPGLGSTAAAWLKDTDSGTELWAGTKGGMFRLSGIGKTRAARSIADEAIRFFERTLKD